ncbi:metallophosphoesterase [Alcanivorax sp. S71-1-4]|uniref:phosphodiester glycosidase family protein n=1 Tax=Alcanivorax sp. S71-1-4 TaxID=1177159 RepID=UPI00135B0F98|nr:phosphodiester glycosidase family protein [Alcanivorax sp. S71-1-4]KAF0808762.1 metallophosphoesterase [Alcanivorax sp. S71-1-4]
MTRRVGRGTLLAFSLLATSYLTGCDGDTKTVYRDKIVEVPGGSTDVPYVDDQSGAEQFSANIITPPDNADDLFAPVPAPVINGTTARETVPTVISDFARFPVNDDLTITRGKLNHVLDEAIISAEFNLGGSLSLVPLNRSQGQFSFERTTASANHAIDQGQNVILAVNADPYDMTQGWNMGLIKADGVTYTGFSDRSEEAVVVYQDGSVDILEEVPEFTLNVYANEQPLGELGNVHYFNNATQVNRSFSRGSSAMELYAAESYRGTIDMRGRTGALIRAEANGVSVIERGDGQISVQLPPLSGVVSARVDDRANYVVPAGHALLVDDGSLAIGTRVDIRYETDDPSWDNVVSAVGAGFGRGLLVENGQLGANQGESAASGRTAFGIRADGSYFFLVVDKPVGSLTDGITETKLAQLMIGYGAVRAINFDGGGSTTLAGRLPGERYTHLLNVPSDGGERVTATKWGLVLNPSLARYSATDVAVYPRDITLLAGSTYRRFRGVGYDSRSWEGSGQIPEYGISTAALGLIDARTGAFRAGNANAEGYVVVQVGEQKGVARVRVTSEIDEIRFGTSEMAIDSGATVNLAPQLLSDGQEVVYSPGTIAYSVDNSSDCILDAQKATVTAAQVQGRSCIVTASAAGQSAQLTLNIGVAPVVMVDFEGDTSMFRAAGARHNNVTIEKVTDQVFAGNYSMKLSWEANPAQPGTFGAYLTDPNRVTTLPGNPKYLGVNVYIPDELAGKVWWVRGSLRDADNKAVTINYNNDGEALPERGWNFMKAEIPAGYTAPFRFDQPFRFLVLKTAERIDSSVILDNFTAIYSDNTDLTGPGVLASPSADDVVDTASPLIALQVNDNSGVDFGSAYLAIDGIDVSAQLVSNHQDRVEYQASDLADGWHRVDYRIHDINGNVSAGDFLFSIETGAPRLFIDSANVQFYPGGTFQLPIRVEGGAEAFGDLSLALDFDATKADLTVVNADLNATDIATSTGRWEGRFTGFDASTGTVAYLQLSVRDYIQNTFVSVVVNGTLDGDTFRHPVIRKEVGSRYRLMTQWGVSGESLRLLVTDQQGQPAPGVTVETFTYNAANDTISDVNVLGNTDNDGFLNVTLPGVAGSTRFQFRAYDDQGSSLMTEVQALVENLTPSPRYIYLTPGNDSSRVNVTWYTASDVTTSQVRYGTGTLDQVREGTSIVLPFFYGAEAGVVRVHHATLDNLAPGTRYRYQVGDGAGNVSNEHSFVTDDGDDQVNIHLFGDTQTVSNDNLFNGSGLVTELYRKMQAQLPDGDLIMHVGDFTEDLSDYRYLRLFLEAMEGEDMLDSRLFVVAEGNHEVYNEGADKFAAMFRYPDSDSGVATPFERAIYSFDYGNTHIAVITSELLAESDWPKMMNWLRADMDASDKTWKIVMIHRPPYNGNPASGNGRVMQYLPPVVDAAGIDLVLSGHDHMYSRSLPLLAGQPNPTGATYLIAGSDSAKYYDNNGGGIARFADVLFDDNVNTYTTLQIDGAQMHVLTRTLNGTVVDDIVLTPRASR